MTNREIAAKRQGFTAYWQASGKANRTDCRPAEPWGARCASVLLHQAKPLVIDAVLSNSFGFGGTNGSLVFRRFNG